MLVRLGGVGCDGCPGCDGPEVGGGKVDGVSPAPLLAVETLFTSSPPHAASAAQVSAATIKSRGFFIFRLVMLIKMNRPASTTAALLLHPGMSQASQGLTVP
ncbi:hypothetical protein [Burkholderia sp. YIM B11467]